MVASLTARSARVLLLLCPLVAVGLTVGASPAQAAIAKLQTGTEATGTGNSISPTLPSASTAGNLLVAVLANGNTFSSNAFSGPSGWTNATGIWQSGNGRVEIWYRANNPGGITSATFTVGNSGGAIIGELTEWSGVAISSPLDKVGTNTSGSSTSSTVSTSAATTLANDVGITAFTTSFAPSSFSAGASWSHLFSDTSRGMVADFGLNLSVATASETESAGFPSSGNWADAIATFKPACAGGSLTLTAPASSSFPAFTLNGTDQTATTTLVLTPDDETASNSGWNITGTSTTLTNAGGKTLSTTATQVTTASAAAATGNCTLPTNSIGYPVTLPAASSPPTAVKLYNAATSTGTGPTDVTLTFQLALPANTFIGTYTSTWTFAIVSGP